MKFSFKFETNVPPRNHFGQKHDLAFDNSIDELLVKSIYIYIKLTSTVDFIHKFFAIITNIDV